MHVAGTDGPDEALAIAVSDRENQKHISAGVCRPDRPEALLGERVFNIHADGVGPREQALDLRDRDAVLLAFFPVSRVLIDPRDPFEHELGTSSYIQMSTAA